MVGRQGSRPCLQLVPFAVVVLGCFPPAIRPGAPQSPTPSISIIEDKVAVVLSVNSDYVQSFTILPLKLGSYLHDDPCSRSSTPPCVGSPRAAASPIIDAEVVVLLHGKPGLGFMAVVDFATSDFETCPKYQNWANFINKSRTES